MGCAHFDVVDVRAFNVRATASRDPWVKCPESLWESGGPHRLSTRARRGSAMRARMKLRPWTRGAQMLCQLDGSKRNAAVTKNDRVRQEGHLSYQSGTNGPRIRCLCSPQWRPTTGPDGTVANAV
jgi:hypothetical protein